MKTSKRIFFFLFLLSNLALAGQRGPLYGFSFAGEGVVPIFKTDLRHSEKAISRPGFGGIFRFHIYASQNVHIQIGFELMSQACSFNTYYFAQGHSEFYDRSFGYTHTLRTTEMYTPILGRIGLGHPSSTSRFTFYLLAGYSPKTFLKTSTNVIRNSDGKGIWEGQTDLKFENWFISEQNGNVLMAGMGLDKRIDLTEKFFTFEIMFRYNLSRFTYNGQFNTNELLIKNMCVGFQVGYRFAGGLKGKK
jgi:hypothetical protein